MSLLDTIRVSDSIRPLHSLEEGHWFKLICGASFQSLPDVRNLALSYALVGADCIDVAADPAVIAAAREGLQTARVWQEEFGGIAPYAKGLPLLMASLNDGEDPHFRKAAFDPNRCPADCSRPCERICPAQAIVFDHRADGYRGVLDNRCYGCGRCLPVCPIEQITTRSYVSSPDAVAASILPLVDAVEIHTQVGRLEDFARLWRAIAPHHHRLKALAISCPDGEGLVEYLWALHKLISPTACPVIWQTDGRPMSGDIGRGVTHAAIKLGQKVLAAGLPGYVQLAGGTNLYTVPKLEELGLLRTKRVPSHDSTQTHTESSPPFIRGVAYGSAARALLVPVLQRLEERTQFTMSAMARSAVPVGASKGEAESQRLSREEDGYAGSMGVEGAIAPTATFLSQRLEAFPDLLQEAVQLAASLVSPLKGFAFPRSPHRHD